MAAHVGLSHELMQTAELMKKQRLVAHISLSISLILTVYLIVTFLVMPDINLGRAITLGAVGFLMLVSWLSKYPSLFTANGFALAVITLLGGFGASISNGGVEGFVAPVLIISPMASGLILGKRAAIISAAFGLLACAGLVFLDQAGLITPSVYPPEELTIISAIFLAAVIMICAAGVGYVVHDVETKFDAITRVQDELRHAATHDPLSGVLNRQGLEQKLDKMLEAPGAPNEQICFIHIDLDKFKEVNDTHGHPVGDSVLRLAAQTMTDHCSDQDLLARVGGDEFAIVRCADTAISSEVSTAFCNALIAKLQQPGIVNRIECQIGASAGFVIADTETSSAEDLVANADAALYEAKRRGRGTTCEYTPSLRHKVRAQNARAKEIETALAEARVSCVLQPQLCVSTGQVVGVESLGRMTTKTGKTLAPAEFLPDLEKLGLLAEFDFRIACKSLDALIRIREAGFSIPTISINASVSSLRSSDYSDKLAAEIDARSLERSDLVIEILETVFIKDADSIEAETIRALRANGMQVVLDDFGSGFASMNTLLQLELDGFKIDRSLISNIESERSQLVVQSILDLSKSLGLKAVAEGIETSQQHMITTSLGCETLQGYGICRPVNAEDLQEWLQQYGASNVTRLQKRVGRAG